MGYLFLILSVACGALKGHCSKRISQKVKGVKNISLLNCIRMLLCVVIGFFTVLIFDEGISGFKLDRYTALVCAFSGFCNAFFVVVWIICVKKSAYSMLDVFFVFATLIPIIVCRFVWEEQISVFKIIGYVILLFAVFFMCVYNNKIKKKMTLKDFILLLLCGALNGGIELAQKWRGFECADRISTLSFNFYTYLFAFIFLSFASLIFSLFTKNEEEELNTRSVFGYIIVLSICLFLYSLFSLNSATYLPSSVLYPASHGLGLVCAMLLGHFFYNEKINKFSLIGIAFAMVSFVFMIL